MSTSRINVARVLIVMVTVLGAVNCGKKKSNGKSSTTTVANGYTTCPANGVYTRNGMTYTCQPGSTYYNGGNNLNGYPPNNGMNNSNQNNICAQYGQGYQLMQYPDGTLVCMPPGSY